jgi:DNA replication licensing factor MCM6
LSAPILSRFDLFFVVLDECDELADYNVAKHILDVHRCIEEAVQPPFTKQQLQRYIRFARTINPVITPESHRVMVECYRGLRQGDSLGRGRTAYRITVRQLESLVRLSEALARLHLDDEVKPVYVREACRLLRKSIIHVETEDVTFDDEFLQEDMIESAMEEEGVHELPNEHIEDPQMIEEKQDEMEVGYNVDDSEPPEEAKDDRKTKGKQKKVKKSKITFEEYERIANSLAVYLRAKEEENPEKPVYLTWNEAVEWYLSQIQGEIGDSIEELNRMKKLTNLVVRRLIEKDRVLVFIGEFDGPEKERLIATHPNYSI